MKDFRVVSENERVIMIGLEKKEKKFLFLFFNLPAPYVCRVEMGSSHSSPLSLLQEKVMVRNKVVVALYPFKAIEGGDLSLDKVSIRVPVVRCIALPVWRPCAGRGAPVRVAGTTRFKGLRGHIAAAALRAATLRSDFETLAGRLVS